MLLETLDAPRFALAVHLHGMDACREHPDEPLYLAFTEGALRMAPDHQHASRWRFVREKLLVGSRYAEVGGRRRPGDKRGHPAVRELIAAVEAAAVRVGLPARVTKDICEALDHNLLPKNIEGTRVKLKRLVKLGILTEVDTGSFARKQ
ncbi:hypothetical protein QQY24_31155 [Streptomyces sp. TG1A-8]|uniref:hypothetical protein n=1 Tax=Streptomyces sp. TG1A-8 TaxID=3051385 RepID=UPI00265BE1E4|nr:hypothetical protein [Streptomyces sp. TG1A-8]MDO0929611.1 hypothetical protein [Streptomyces sp. TG1A-8]